TGGSIRTFQIVDSSLQVGAFSSGRIVEVENGFGAKSQVNYASAKNDASTLHSLPYPEIVVSSVTTSTQLETLEPTRYAYGDAQLRFDTALDQWIFPGYGRRVTLRGLPDPASTARRRLVKGQATIFDSAVLNDFPTGYEKYALVGRIKDVHFIDGRLSNDPWEMLTLNVRDSASWHGQIHYEHDARSRTLASPNIDCTVMGSPYKVTGPAYFVFDEGTFDWPCTATGFGFAKEVTYWEGKRAPPSDENVQGRYRILSIDEIGRPLLVAHDNDTFLSGDDLCERISYPTNTGEHHILNAIHTRR
ncbi:MAG: hypothetical protein GTO40_01595, partial [Deltaproteobacteria bacterium]|nr:hypothetical protein [Deltaproteobacteria bacterium]